MKQLPLKVLIFSAVLAAFSATVQLIHVGYQSPQWGMWIDIVSVSWIMAFFLFGLRSSFIVTVLGTIVITLFAPDTWLGASMKLVATVPLIIALFAVMKMQKKERTMYKNPLQLLVPLIVGSIIRSLVVLPLNYYYALPIWTHMTTAQAIAAIPWYIIAGFNTVQSVLDIVLALILVYPFKLSKYSTHETIEEPNHHS